jgi:phage-related tail fiber protein
MFGSTRLVAGIGGIALALALGWGLRVNSLRAHWHGKFDTLNGEAVVVLAAAGRAADNPKLRWADVPEQIELLGASRKAWKGTAELQSSRIDALGVEAARLQALNADLRTRAQAAIARRDVAIRRLDRDALTPGERVDCARQLIEAEAALDLVYREGI